MLRFSATNRDRIVIGKTLVERLGKVDVLDFLHEFPRIDVCCP